MRLKQFVVWPNPTHTRTTIRFCHSCGNRPDVDTADTPSYQAFYLIQKVKIRLTVGHGRAVPKEAEARRPVMRQTAEQLQRKQMGNERTGSGDRDRWKAAAPRKHNQSGLETGLCV